MVFKQQLRKRNISLEDNFPVLAFFLPCKTNFTGFPSSSEEMISLQVINFVVEGLVTVKVTIMADALDWQG